MTLTGHESWSLQFKNKDTQISKDIILTNIVPGRAKCQNGIAGSMMVGNMISKSLEDWMLISDSTRQPMVIGLNLNWQLCLCFLRFSSPLIIARGLGHPWKVIEIGAFKSTFSVLINVYKCMYFTNEERIKKEDNTYNHILNHFCEILFSSHSH